jgi:hypothetical protein
MANLMKEFQQRMDAGHRRAMSKDNEENALYEKRLAYVYEWFCCSDATVEDIEDRLKIEYETVNNMIREIIYRLEQTVEAIKNEANPKVIEDIDEDFDPRMMTDEEYREVCKERLEWDKEMFKDG